MRVLVVEDDPGVRDTLSDLLLAAGHSVTAAEGFAEAMALLNRCGWDVLLTDMVLPGGSGLELAEHVRARGMGAVICSGHPTRIEQMRSARVSHLVKPFTARELEAALADVAPAAACCTGTA